MLIWVPPPFFEMSKHKHKVSVEVQEQFSALPILISLLLSNSISEEFAIICLIRQGEYVAEQATKNKSSPTAHVHVLY